MTWQTIDSAPKSTDIDTLIFVDLWVQYADGSGTRLPDCYYLDGKWCAANVYNGCILQDLDVSDRITHWLAVPESPFSEKDSEKWYETLWQAVPDLIEMGYGIISKLFKS